MIPNNCNYKKVHIQITTYEKKQPVKKMSYERDTAKSFIRSDNSSKFICSICLNTKPKCEEVTKITECNNRKSKSCPICQKDFSLRCEASNEHNLIHDKCVVNENPIKIPCNQPAFNSKIVQTSETDVSHGLNLLNEVLTVFQSKKNFCIEKERYGKTVIVKDASVETENLFCKNYTQSKLGVSKIFIMSIDENAIGAINKFTVVNSVQPQRNINSQKSIDLIKHKSSSIPQMKLEELKKSLKEKTKSKDAIEEVNRMFATVRKNALRENLDDSNRPLIRNGPRVLPVVKASNKPYTSEGVSAISNYNNSNSERKKGDAGNCRYCQTNNYLLSSGDSIAKPEYCQQKNNDNTKCVFATRNRKCCHHSHNHCDHYHQRLLDNGCQPDRPDDGQNDDSCPSF